MAPVKLRLFIVALVAVAAQGQTVVWTKFDPGAVRVGRTDPAILDVQTNGPVTAVALDYAAGGRLNLTAAGPNRWTASVDAAHLLANYSADNFNHNFVGFLRLLDSSGQTLSSYNEFINVVDANVPSAVVTDLGGGAQATTRILNLFRPALTVTDIQAASQQFYTFYRDDFDFLSVAFSMPNYPANRYHLALRNDVSGIGAPLHNNGAIYGSASRLLGITVFPIDTLFDAGEPAFIHEIGHQWIMYSKNTSLGTGPHWPPSTMARGIMGWNIPPTNEGGDFPWTITPVSGTTARTNFGTVTREFDDFDLYLMGFIPPSAVFPGVILQAQPCEGCVVATAPITIGDVVQVNGVRAPAAGAAKTSFRVATLVISRDRLLNADEMAVLDYFAARGEAQTPLPYTSGLARGTAKPFAVATRGIGRLDLRLTVVPRRRSARH